MDLSPKIIDFKAKDTLSKRVVTCNTLSDGDSEICLRMAEMNRHTLGFAGLQVGL
jgi:hypothetical protein